MKKIVLMCFLSVLILFVGTGCEQKQEKNANKETNSTIQQGSENQEDIGNENETTDEGTNGGIQDVTGDDINNNDIQKGEFYIEERDVILGNGFEYINEEYKEVIKEFVRMTLLGYGGNGSLVDIKEINERIFAEDSINREDYAARMNAFEQCEHEKYLWGWSEVEVLGDIEKDNKSIALTVRIVYYLCYHNWGTYYSQIATEASYTLELVEKSSGVCIESSKPGSKNSFDGAEGTGEILLVRPEIEFDKDEFEYAQEFAQLTKDEQEVIKKFVLQSVLADQGYAALEKVAAINEEIFHPNAQQKYDYIKHISTIERYTWVYRTCEVDVEFMEMSGTEEERVIKLSIDKTQTSGSWNEGVLKGNHKDFFQWIYVLTLQKVDDKVFITNCIKHENALY